MTAPWVAPVAGDARLRPARELLAEGRVVEISGLAGPARLLLPLLLTEAPLLVVTPHERDVEAAADDLRTLAREAGRGGAVLAFPAPGPCLLYTSDAADE